MNDILDSLARITWPGAFVSVSAILAIGLVGYRHPIVPLVSVCLLAWWVTR